MNLRPIGPIFIIYVDCILTLAYPQHADTETKLTRNDAYEYCTGHRPKMNSNPAYELHRAID